MYASYPPLKYLSCQYSAAQRLQTNKQPRSFNLVDISPASTAEDQLIGASWKTAVAGRSQKVVAKLILFAPIVVAYHVRYGLKSCHVKKVMLCGRGSMYEEPSRIKSESRSSCRGMVLFLHPKHSHLLILVGSMYPVMGFLFSPEITFV
jgi:hypothetical protein